MTTSKESEAKRPLKLNRPGKLQLKKTVETGQVRQSFSHGRSKAVTVEVKRSRTFERGSSGRMKEVTESGKEAEKVLAEAAADAPVETVEEKPSSKHHLSAEERASRARALEIAKEEEASRREREAEEAERRAEQAKLAAAERERREAEEEAERAKAAEEAKREAELEAERAATQAAAAAP
ncbi:MAG TPA: translation initiation factor IF-2, partial [Kiloniellaceae bacterium]|nr:translation initiation factor IF-2 [Kiloniellaceae bacterium]